MRRKICWPYPDTVCLEGGCSYCQTEGVFKTKRELIEYIEEITDADKQVKYRDALYWGLDKNINNIWKGR